MNDFTDIVLDDKITSSQIRLKDVIDHRLPVSVENLDFSHMNFEEGKIPDLSFMEIHGLFDCSHTNISTFEGFPQVKGSLDMSNSMIKNLDLCPNQIQYLEISCTEVSSFLGCPSDIVSIDAWNTKVDNFSHLPNNIKKLGVGKTGIRDLSQCPKRVENLTADYLDVNTMEGLPEGLKVLSISGSFVENFKGCPPRLEEITCYQNPNLRSLDGLNIETLKGIAIMGCPNILPEELDAYYDAIKASTLLEKQEILENFWSKKETIIKQKIIDFERRQHK